jgi:hypothetical protein
MYGELVDTLLVHCDGHASQQSIVPDGEFIEPCLQAVEVVGEVAEAESGLLQRGVDGGTMIWPIKACKCRSIAEIAEAEKISRSFAGRLLRLTLLAPGI